MPEVLHTSAATMQPTHTNVDSERHMNVQNQRCKHAICGNSPAASPPAELQSPTDGNGRPPPEEPGTAARTDTSRHQHDPGRRYSIMRPHSLRGRSSRHDHTDQLQHRCRPERDHRRRHLPVRLLRHHRSATRQPWQPISVRHPERNHADPLYQRPGRHLRRARSIADLQCAAGRDPHAQRDRPATRIGHRATRSRRRPRQRWGRRNERR